MLYSLSVFIVRIIFKCFIKLEVLGRENVPKQGAFILASNHLSNIDPPLLAACCPRRIAFLAKEELFKNPLVSFYLHSVGAVPLQRQKRDIRSIRTCLEILKKKPLLIFPQGTREGSFDSAKGGVGFLQKKSAIPVVAARISGTEHILPRGAKSLRKGKVSVEFIRIDDISPVDDYEAVTGKIITRIKGL